MPKPIVYPDRISLARVPTPFEPMERLTQLVGGPPLWIKRDDMTGLELTGNKSRKLEFLIAQAKAQGCDTLFTYGGIQSNHCRATAAVGAKLGFKVRLILRGDRPNEAPDGNLLLDHLFGADVSFVSPQDFTANKQAILDQTLDELRRQGLKPYYFPVGASTPLGVWAYVKCLEELREQTRQAGVQLRHIVTACGSGGTAAGLILGRALLGWKDLSIWAVAVTLNEAFWRADLKKLLEDTCNEYKLGVAPDDLPIQVTDAYVGPGYAISYPEEISVIQQTARAEAIILDPVYTGKALTGMLDLIRRGMIGRDEPTAFLHTGGVFGLFPARKEFFS